MATASRSEETVLDIVDEIATEVIAGNAGDTDRQGKFPAENIAALGKRGILGLITDESCGGLGLGMVAASRVVARIARDCPSTGMIVTMHFCAVAVLERYGSIDVRRAIAAGEHLCTLAFSELGSRSHFWAPVSAARRVGGKVELNARKSFTTAAGHADSYVWTSKPLAAEGMSTLWHVAREQDGIAVPAPFDGLGLRGNDSAPITADGVSVSESDMLGEDGQGFEIMMDVVNPWFCVLAASVSVGLMQGALARTIAHVSAVRYEQDGGAGLRDLPTIRAYVARMQIKTDMAAVFLDDCVAAAAGGRDDAPVRVMQSKAGVAESASEVVSLAMRVCGGAAYRKDLGIERYFRDAQAATVMSPTTDILYDFIGKAVLGMPLF